MLQYLVILGAVVGLLGTFLYIRDTLRGTTRPNRVTWFFWALAPLIGFASAFSDGVRWSALPVFMVGFGPVLVLCASFINKNSYWKLEVFDYVCGASCALALFLWWLTKDPLMAIVFAIFGDALAALPTLVKSFKYPETETGIAYGTALFNTGTSVFAFKMWNFSEVAFPLYLISLNSLLLLVIYRRHIYKRLGL